MLTLDIAEISAIGFYFNLWQKGTQAFATLIYKIDLLIDYKEAKQNKDQETIDLIYIKLPIVYQKYINVFLKRKSN